MDKNEKNDNRREHKRKDIRMMVQLENVLGMVENISEGGMRIIPDSFPERITSVQISFRNNEDKLFELTGNIVWFKGIGDDKYQIGLKFSKLFDQFEKKFTLEKDKD